MKSKTNWKKLKSMTEKEIIAAAKSDPDALPLTKAELKKFKRVNSPTQINVRMIRDKLDLSQEQFGLWSALSIHDTSSVVGASMQYGEKALEIAKK